MARPRNEREGYAGNYMRRVIAEGITPTEGLRRFRDAGGSIGTQAWYRAFGEVVSSIERAGRVGSAPLNRRPVADEVQQWSVVRSTGYVYQAEVQVRIRGTSEVFNRPMSLRTDSLISYGNALDAIVADADSFGDEYDELTLGGVITGVYELVPQ